MRRAYAAGIVAVSAAAIAVPLGIVAGPGVGIAAASGAVLLLGAIALLTLARHPSADTRERSYVEQRIDAVQNTCPNWTHVRWVGDSPTSKVSLRLSCLCDGCTYPTVPGRWLQAHGIEPVASSGGVTALLMLNTKVDQSDLDAEGDLLQRQATVSVKYRAGIETQGISAVTYVHSRPITTPGAADEPTLIKEGTRA